MNLLTKVFIVLNFVLSVTFAYFALVQYAKHSDWIGENQRVVADFNKYRQETTTVLAENEKSIADLKEQLGSVTAHAEGLRGQVETELRTNRELNTRNAEQSKRLDTMNTSMDTLSTKYSDLSDTLKTMTTERNKSVDDSLKAQRERDFAQRTAIEVSNDLKLVEEELRDAVKRNNDLMARMLEAQDLIARVQARNPEAFDESTAPVRPVSGKVMRVEDSVGLVILSLGKTDEIKVGMRLVVSRGDEYIGKVTIQNIYDEMCSAIIDTPVTRKPIRVGDVAQTL